MKLLFICLISFYFNSYSNLFGYELRLHLDRTYIVDDELFSDIYVGGDLTDIIRNYVDSGVVVVFNYRIDLFESVFGLDNIISQVFFYRRIYYDFFTREYVMYISETGRDIRRNNIEELLNDFYAVNGISISDLRYIKSYKDFYIKTRVSLKLENSYPYLTVLFSILTPLRYRIKWLKTADFTLDSLKN